MIGCFYWQKLKQVFEQLVLQAELTLDDTCLQKLLDGVKATLMRETEKDLGVFCEFLAAVSLEGDSDGRVRSFSVHLFGALCETEAVFKQLLQNGTVDSFFGQVNCILLKQDLSVLSATFSTLRTIVSHRSGLSWLLQSHFDVISTSFEVLKSGTSVFVVSSCQRFLADLCYSLTSLQTGVNDEVCADAQKDMLHRTWTMIEHCGEAKCPVGRTPTTRAHTAQCLAGLQLVKSFIDKGHNCCLITPDKVEILLNCLFTSDHSVHCYALDILQTCYDSVEMGLTACIHSSVHKTAENLLHSGHESSSLSLAQRMFHRFPVADRGRLQDIAMAPFNLVLDKSSQPLTVRPQLLTSAVASRSLATRTLSATINSLLHLSSQEKQTELLKVLKILEVTMGRPVEHSPAVSVHIQGNSSIQMCCLDAVKQCFDAGLSDGLSPRILTAAYLMLISFTEDSQTPVQILMPLFKTWKSALILNWQLDKGDARVKGDDSNDSLSEVLVRLSVCVEKKLCDLQWEIRDTALDFLCDLLAENDVPEGVDWLISHGLHVSLWQCVRDQESYVRASALSAVRHLLQRESQCLQEHSSLEDIIEKVCNIVQTDTEAFPRRAAVDLLPVFLDFTDTSPDQRKNIFSTLSHAAMKDFDWDVQVKALNFWGSFIDRTLTTNCSKETIPDYAASLIETQINGLNKNLCISEELEKSGVFSVLLNALEDCDRSVREQSCKILIKIKPKLFENLTVHSKGNKKLKMDKSLHGCESKSQDSDYLISTENFIDILNGMDLQAKLSTLCKSSDEYIRNPESLLDDILNSFSTADSEHVIDCY